MQPRRTDRATLRWPLWGPLSALLLAAGSLLHGCGDGAAPLVSAPDGGDAGSFTGGDAGTVDGGDAGTVDGGDAGASDAGVFTSPTLCAPCTASSECASGGLCVGNTGHTAWFCTQDCAHAPCPDGYACASDQTGTEHQCYPLSGACADLGIDGGVPDGGVEQAASCAVPLMTDQYAGAFPPNPYGSVQAAGGCAVPHDAIVVLGCPSNTDGTPSTCQTRRADLAVALSKSGYAAQFIVSGAAVHNQYVEADALAALLIARGIDAGHIWRDLRAQHTDENLYYSDRIMEAHGWSTALVVSEDAGQLIDTAVCDSNCCVDLGRLTVLEFPLGDGAQKLGHYVRYPWAAQVSVRECNQIERTLKFMCTKLSSRHACLGNLQIPP